MTVSYSYSRRRTLASGGVESVFDILRHRGSTVKFNVFMRDIEAEIGGINPVRYQ
jgi:hypothetical protein